MDDLLCGFKTLEIERIWKEEINKHLTLEERGRPERFLGMDVKWGDKQVTIAAPSAIEKLAQDLQVTRGAVSPFTPDLEELNHVSGDIKAFQAITGRLLFITRMWRPDIRYAVQRLCMRTKCATQQDMRRATRIAAYLLHTKNDGIKLTPAATAPVDIFCDAGEEKLEEKATSGILTKLGDSPISWASRKQDVTTLSSTEAEYIALSMGVQDGMWLQKVMEFLEEERTPRVWTDNKGAAILTENPDFHRRTKHIRRRHHFIRECAEEGSVTVHWVPGEENPADMLTKVVTGPRLTELKGQAGMTDSEGVIPLGGRGNRITRAEGLKG